LDLLSRLRGKTVDTEEIERLRLQRVEEEAIEKQKAEELKPVRRAPKRVVRQYYDRSVRDVSNSVGPQSEKLELPQHFGSVPNWNRVSSARLFDGFGKGVGSPIEKYGGGLPRFWSKKRKNKSWLKPKGKGVFG